MYPWGRSRRQKSRGLCGPHVPGKVKITRKNGTGYRRPSEVPYRRYNAAEASLRRDRLEVVDDAIDNRESGYKGIDFHRSPAQGALQC